MYRIEFLFVFNSTNMCWQAYFKRDWLAKPRSKVMLDYCRLLEILKYAYAKKEKTILYIYICMYVCMHVCMHVYMYIYSLQIQKFRSILQVHRT